MKTKLIAVLFLLTNLFIGCKDEKSVDNLDVVESVEKKNLFKVVLSLTIKKDDNLSLYYTTDGTTDFSKMPTIWKGVKGSASSQNVEFELPEDVIPTQLRLDFGTNEKQEDVVLSNVKLSYIGKERNIGCPELVTFFRADDNKCTFDHVTGLIKAKTVGGKKQFPSLYPHEEALGAELKKLVR